MILNPGTAPAGVHVALVQLENHPDFQVVMAYLRDCLAGERARYETIEMPDLASFARQQGRVMALGQIGDLVQGARARALALRSRAATHNESRI